MAKLKFNSAFSNICPPPAAVVTLGPDDCRSLYSSAFATCQYVDNCGQHTPKLLNRLRLTYSSSIKVTMSEPSSSVVVRSEHQFNREERLRLSMRKHFYELESPRSNTVANACESLQDDDRFGRYLGFVDLRMYPTEAPLAMGLLTPPRRFRHNDRVNLALGEYGPIFGGPSFSSSVYAFQDPESGGAYCSHSSMVMALAALSDRGALLAGAFTLAYVAALVSQKPKSTNSGTDCVGVYATPKLTFSVDPITPEELSEVFAKFEATALDIRLYISIDEAYGRLFEKLVRAYVTARLPIILYVDSVAWWPEKRDELMKRAFEDYEQKEGRKIDDAERMNLCTRTANGDAKVWPEAHTINIVGYRQRADGRGLISLIVHDPGSRPYFERSLEFCIAAACDIPGYSGQLSAVLAGPSRLRAHATKCIEWLCRPSIKGSRSHSLDYELFQGYYRAQYGSDYDIQLVHRNDIIELIMPLVPTAGDASYIKNYADIRERLKAVIDLVAPGWLWSISGFDQTGRLEVFWLFSSEDMDSQGNVKLLLRVDCAGIMTFDKIVENAVMIDTSSPYLMGRHSAFPTTVDVEPAVIAEVVPVDKRLSCSVITSSSDFPLSGMVRQLGDISNLKTVDLYLLRDIDVREIMELKNQEEWTDPAGQTNVKTITRLMANADVGKLGDWILDQFDDVGSGPPASAATGGKTKARLLKSRIAAFATYFPDLSYPCALKQDDGQNRRMWAIDALANCVRLACRLHKEKLSETEVPFASPIIEIVCGVRLDRCHCSSCQDKIIWEFDDEAKFNILFTSLTEVCQRVDQDESDRGVSYKFALELEPGLTYALRDEATLKTAARLLLQKYPQLADRVGLNLDIAHWRAARVPLELLSERIPESTLTPPQTYGDLVVHSHICDLPPQMHSRDQPLGRWDPIDSKGDGHAAWLSRLAKYAGRDFSRHVAVELEGCGRIDWVHRSIASLRQVLSAIQ